jgi:hypothetical protein
LLQQDERVAHVVGINGWMPAGDLTHLVGQLLSPS